MRVIFTRIDQSECFVCFSLPPGKVYPSGVNLPLAIRSLEPFYGLYRRKIITFFRLCLLRIEFRDLELKKVQNRSAHI